MTLPLSSLPAGLWRASELAQYHRAGQPTGFAALDAELPGAGWPHGAVTELLSERPGIGEWRLLAPALRDLTQAGQPVMVIAPPMLPYAPALAGWGIDLRWLSVVTRPERNAPRSTPATRTSTRTTTRTAIRTAAGTTTRARSVRAEDRDMLWCAEQALKSACCGAVLAWLPAATPEQIRRLQVAAGGGDALAWVMRPPTAAATASAAPLRLGLSVGEDSRLGVQFHKRRGPPRTEPIWLTLPAPYVRAEHPTQPVAGDDAAVPLAPRPAPSSAPSAVPSASASGVSHGLLDRPAPAISRARDRLPANAG
ncbi:damage-inducible protein [Pandoraea sp. PE-S2T-3]|uniref:damage-inducible protein n=1 Tax=Pandoraea sp. PE-S2T-3 TaxID=1986993 RepID=UPI0015951035|nr:damage-inducible protein [Pandoraea sp. PE-S2T-3]